MFCDMDASFFKKTIFSFLIFLSATYLSLPNQVFSQTMPTIPSRVFHFDAMDINGNGVMTDQPADGAKISSWVSKGSAADITAYMTTTTAQPTLINNGINGRPSVLFSNTTDQYLDINLHSEINTSPTYPMKSMALVFKSGPSVSNTQIIYEQGGNARGYSYVIHDGEIWFGLNNNIEWSAAHRYKSVSLGTVLPNTVYLIVAVQDSRNTDISQNTLSIYYNGTLMNVSYNIGVQNYHPGEVGLARVHQHIINPATSTVSEESTEPYNLKGAMIGEFIQWNNVLTLGDIKELNDYFAEKWDVTIFEEIVPVRRIDNNVNQQSLLYIFSTNQTGTLSYSGGCDASLTHAIVGHNRINLTDINGDQLADGFYNNCKITLHKDSGEDSVLAIKPFTLDSNALPLTLIGETFNQVRDSTPTITFNSPVAGIAEVTGYCKAPAMNVSVGENSITLNPMSDGIYTNCIINVPNAASLYLGDMTVPGFTVDSTPPGYNITRQIETPSVQYVRDFEIEVSERAYLSTLSGSCQVENEILEKGANTVVLQSLNPGTHICTFRLSDNVENSTSITLNTFQILNASLNFSKNNASIVEGGVQDFINVSLGGTPSNNVKIVMTSVDPSKVTISPTSFTVLASNPGETAKFIFTAVDDDIAFIDGAMQVEVSTSESGATEFADLLPYTLNLSISDNDSANYIVDVPENNTFNENGEMNFTVRLTSRPTSDVTLTALSGDSTQMLFADGNNTRSVVFTPADWNSPATFTVKGVSDQRQDGDANVSVLFSVTGALEYEESGAADQFAVTVVDTDVAGYTYTGPLDPTVAESGFGKEFSIVLNTRPFTDVRLNMNISGDNFILSKQYVVFTPDNWNSPQEIIVSAVDDAKADGTQNGTLVFSVLTSDGGYSPIKPEDKTFYAADNDTAGYIIRSAGGNELPEEIMTGEDGSQAIFAMSLNSLPTSPVRLLLAVSDDSEGSVNPTELILNENNWQALNTITVTGLNDDAVDGNQPFIVNFTLISAGTDYQNLTLPTGISFINTDDDSPGYSIQVIGNGEVSESGTSERFTINLTGGPLDNVVLDIASGDTGEIIVNPSQLVFTRDNWNSPRDIIVTGVNDNIIDGNTVSAVSFQISSLTRDASYQQEGAPSAIMFTNIDDDSASINITASDGSDLSNILRTSEEGEQLAFSLSLASKPSADVTVEVISGNTAEVSVLTPSIIFTPEGWNSLQTIILQGEDDKVADGTIPSNISFKIFSLDSDYDGLSRENLIVSNTDNDSAGFNVTISDAETGENGDSATITIGLTSEPSAPVVLDLSISDAFEAQFDNGLDIKTVTFPKGDMGLKNVIIRGLDDNMADGNQPFRVTYQIATDSAVEYQGLAEIPASELSNTDNDSAGINVSDISGNTDEDGNPALFSVFLNSSPYSDVKITAVVTPSDESIVLPDQAVTFTPDNYASPVEFRLIGVDDPYADGEQGVTVAFVLESDDPGYSGLAVPVLNTVVSDNDTAAFNKPQVSGELLEGVSTLEISMKISTPPVTNVTITPVGNYPGLVFNPESFTFIESNFASKVVFSVSTPYDHELTGNEPVLISFKVSTGDPAYSLLVPEAVSVIRLDNEFPGFDIVKAQESFGENGGQSSFTIRAKVNPQIDTLLQLGVDKSEKADLSVQDLLFTASDWGKTRTVTVTGIDNRIQDGDIPIKVGFTMLSGNELFSSAVPEDVAFVSLDDDQAGVDVLDVSEEVSENGPPGTLLISLNTQPTSDVSLLLIPESTDRILLTPKVIIFNDGNWGRPQLVQITTRDNKQIEGDIDTTFSVKVRHGSAPEYTVLSPVYETIQVNDNDVPSVLLEAEKTVTDELGGYTTVLVSLNSEPEEDVGITLSSSNENEGIPEEKNIVISPSNWKSGKEVKITGVNDQNGDGNINYTITARVDDNAPLMYRGQQDSIELTNLDNDTEIPAVTLLSPSNHTKLPRSEFMTFEFEVMSTDDAINNFLVQVCHSSDFSECEHKEQFLIPVQKAKDGFLIYLPLLILGLLPLGFMGNQGKTRKNRWLRRTGLILFFAGLVWSCEIQTKNSGISHVGSIDQPENSYQEDVNTERLNSKSVFSAGYKSENEDIIFWKVVTSDNTSNDAGKTRTVFFE